MDRRQIVWSRLSKYLKEDKQDFVSEIFSECFDFSPLMVWDRIVADLVNIMHQRAQQHNKVVKVVQVKAKFGNLRFYTQGDNDDFLRGAIKMAEVQCARLCPSCGSVGEKKILTGRYITKCVKCDEEHGRFEMT